MRSIKNITILGAEGAKVDGIVLKTGAQPGDWNVTAVVNNLVIDGVEFTDAFAASTAGYNASLMITTSNATVDGLTVKNCKLIGDNKKLNLVYLYGADSSKNVTLTGNVVDGVARLCELRGTENVTITDNVIKNTYEHAMLLAGANYKGNVTITGNTATNIKDRFVRMAGAENATVVIKNNIIFDYQGGDEDYIKVTDANNVVINTADIQDNYVLSGVYTFDELEAAINAAQEEEGDVIGILANINGNGQTIKLPATLKNVTIKGVNGATLKDMTISAADGNSYNYQNLTFDGLTFDNSRILLTGWRNGEEVIENLTVTNCTFKNLADDNNTAPVHINKDAAEAVNGFTFTNNVIDGATGGSKSGVYAQVTGEVVFTGNVINNVAFRPYVIQVTTDDGIADRFVVTGNTFSGSSVGRAQGLGSNAAGTDDVTLVVSKNIFKGITNAQQICYWQFNAGKTTADLSLNYYDIDIEAYPSKIYYNSAAASVQDLQSMGVYPIYTELNADGTINENSIYTPTLQ